MNILVTGSSGYLGRVLVPILEEIGHTVWPVDAGWYGIADGHDLCGFEDIKPSQLAAVDGVVHLAWFSSAGGGNASLHQRLSHDTVTFAAKCAEYGVSVFAFASTASVYGDHGSIGRESVEPQPNADCAYSTSKLLTERELDMFGGDMRIVCFRKATLMGYSPRLRLDLCINAFTDQAVNTGKIRIWGGDKRRPVLNVRDAAAAYAMSMDHPAMSGTINLGCTSNTIRDLARETSEIVSSHEDHRRTITVVEDERRDDPRSYALDTKKSKELGLLPKWGVADAVIGIAGIVKDLSPTDRFRGYNQANLDWMRQARVWKGG